MTYLATSLKLAKFSVTERTAGFGSTCIHFLHISCLVLFRFFSEMWVSGSVCYIRIRFYSHLQPPYVGVYLVTSEAIFSYNIKIPEDRQSSDRETQVVTYFVIYFIKMT